MNPVQNPYLRVAALGAATAMVGIAGTAPVHAAPAPEQSSGTVRVVNTETVQVYTSPTGKPDTRRIYEQLALSGNGTIEVKNPVSKNGLRNLDGFGGFDVRDGEQVVEATVDGEQRLRTVSDYTGDLPLEVSVSYKLDGKSVQPGDVVGASGRLQVSYTVENVTGERQELTFPDGKGGTMTTTASVPVPMVGSLTTVAPPNFTNVASDEANMAGDGKGGRKLSYTMTLFPPIGSTKATFGYTADISEGVVPRADITALPVNPLESPSFKSAAGSYQGGADTGAALVDGATTIDTNLLKLRDGAADLLAGLVQLRDGADQLSAGLQDEAAPGARKLADGAGQLDDGAGLLSAGAGTLKDGTSKASAGSKDLTDGLRRIDGGLSDLADGSTGLPAAKDGIKQLQDGVKVILAGFGTAGDAESLIGGLTALETGLGQLETGSGDLAGGLGQLAGQLPNAKGGVDQVQAGLDSALSGGGSLDRLAGGLNAVKDNFCATHPAPAQCNQLVDQLLAGVQQSRTDLTTASGGLGQVSTGLATAIGGLDTKLVPGAQLLNEKLNTARTSTGKLQGGAVKLKGGVTQVSGGLDDLSAGLLAAVSGVFQLSDGASAAAAGSSDLSEGLGQLDDGAGQLAGGAGDLADGTGQLDDGASKLASGLGDAADGSGRLSEGLGEAAAGAPQLVNGAERLSAEGTQKLIEAGEGTAQNYGELYASMQAGAERAQTEDMAIGAPAEATGLTAYSYVIEGDDGEAGRNLGRGLGGLALLGLGGGLFALRRRFA